jgi:hypothetical protein
MTKVADPKLSQQFQEFDTAHPGVYNVFVALAKSMYAELLAAGQRPVFSAKFVWEKLRWEFKLGRVSGGKFNLDNDLVSRYARKLAAEDARFKGAFKFRGLRTI